MIANKHLSKIIIALMAVAVAVCILAIVFSDKLVDALGGTGVKMEYETALFDTSEVIEVNIIMDEEQWNKMLANATSEEYYTCDVVVNGKKFKNVAIRPKGNTSLSAIAMDSTTDRYSFKLEFDHYIESQTCYGLDKLILNNNYADATNMKEAIIYDMFQYLGADASLYNYAKVSVNGEYWGVYLALEAVEDSFMIRNYGSQDGELYKPESLGMGGGGGNAAGGNSQGKPEENPGGNADASGSSGDSDASGSSGNFDAGGSMGDFNGGADVTGAPEGMAPTGTVPTGAADNTGNADASGSMGGVGFDMGNIDMSQFGGGGSSSGNGGSDLNYTDDDLDSYSTIWESAITGTTKADHKRVVEALKNINQGTNIEDYLDIDNVLKYMAAHVFAVNMDSLSGNMAHNYYLYEYDGKLNLIPWDYNLSFGGLTMSAGSASAMINDAIDTPFAGTDFFDKILENDEYRERYHAYLQQLVDEYIYGGRFEETYNRIRNQIDSLVETDPTAFYTYDEYLAAVEMFCNTLTLRAASIDGQLNGSIPSTDAGQTADSSSLIDASSINIEVMGQFNMMGMMGGNFGDFGGNSDAGGSTNPDGSGSFGGDNNTGGTVDTGNSGDTGNPAPTGSPETGDSAGSEGNADASGSEGNADASGSEGNADASGSEGNADTSGSEGNADFSGSTGDAGGATGAPAISGTPNITGMPAVSGTPDITGMPAVSGTPDVSGMPNISGMPDIAGGSFDPSSMGGMFGGSGTAGGTSNPANRLQNAATFGVCFLAMLGAYFVIKKTGRR